MKRVLFIAPDSYPVTGAESIVNMKLLQALSNSNHFVIDVVSRRRKWSNYPSDTLESYNVTLNSLNVIEVDNKISMGTIIQTVRTFTTFGILAKGSHWSIAALPTIKELLRTNKYDYVLTKNAPSYLLGAYVQKHFNVKWVATWNDPYPSEKYPTPYGLGKDCKEDYFMKKKIATMRKADLHIFPNDRLKRYMLSYLDIDDSKTCIIPHAIDEDKILIRKPDSEKELKLIHSGNLNNPRNPHNLLVALSRFVKTKSDAISLTILGKANKELTNDIEELGLGRYVKYCAPVEYKQSIKVLEDYHISVIVEADCNEGIFLPTKVSDFMQAGIPIFSISPKEGVLSDLHNEGYVPYFAPINDVDAIYSQLEKIYEDRVHGKINYGALVKPEYKSSNIATLYNEFFDK